MTAAEIHTTDKHTLRNMSEAKGKVLITNARIWVSGEADKDWLILDECTGRVTDIGEGVPPPQLSATVRHTIDAHGSRILPGFHDSHIHVSLTGQAALSCDLKNCTSMDEFKQRVASYAAEYPDKAWIVGSGWEQDKLSRYPTCEDLDEVCADRPILLARICEHIAVANSKALRIAGIDHATSVPQGSDIDKFPPGHDRAGHPSGVLREFEVLKLVRQHIKYSQEEKLLWITTGLHQCLSNGCTAVHSIEEDMWEEYKLLARQKKLPIRVFVSAMWEDKDSGNFPAYAGEHVGDILSCDRIKLFADGGLGGATAALSLPYKQQQQRGLLTHKQEALNAMVHEATATGYRLEIHVIGDRAADAALTALETARVAPEKRPILTHCQVVREDLVGRMRSLGVIANIQPQFVTTDARWIDDLLPEPLLPWAYAWKSLIDRGIMCAGGSDAPIESPEPLIGIYDAIYRPAGRRDADNQQSFRAGERLSVRAALELYTRAGAHTAMREHDLGQLLPGFFADFVMLTPGSDPVHDPALFLTARVDQVWVAGKRVK